MTVKDIVDECLVKMGKRDLIDKQEYSPQEKELEDDIVAAVNSAYCEIAVDFPEVVSENVKVLDGELKYSALERPLLYPIRLEAGGETVNFKAYPTRLVALMSGNATLTYAVAFNKKLAKDDDIPDARCTKATLSDGALAKYYFANKVFDLAAAYDTDFRYGVAKMRRKGRCLIMKEQRWWQ